MKVGAHRTEVCGIVVTHHSIIAFLNFCLQDISLLWWACAILGVNSRALCSKLKDAGKGWVEGTAQDS